MLPVGTIATKVMLEKMYDSHVTLVLSHSLEPVPVPPRARKRYRLIKEIPASREEYLKLKNVYFSRPLLEVIESAYAEIAVLAEELQNWYDNLPEPLTEGELAQNLQTAIEELVSDPPAIPEDMASIPVSHFPVLEHTRAGRRDDAVAAVRECIATIPRPVTPPQLEAIGEMMEHVESWEGVEFPVAYR